MDKNIIKEIEVLNKQIQKELRKSQKKIDMDKVKEFQHRIIELENLKRTEPDQIQNIIETLKTKAETEKQSFDLQPVTNPKFIFKRLAVATICFLFLIFSTFSITAIAVGGFDKAWVNISAYVKELLNLPSGKYETDEITLIKGNSSKRFNSIEELLEAEHLQILYPSKLPNDIKLKKVSLISSDDKIYINFNYDPSIFSISIVPIEKMINDPSKLQTINNLECYIYQIDENYQAIFYYNDKEYTVVHADYNELIEIISNLTFSK